jgi:hypothetical protein
MVHGCGCVCVLMGSCMLWYSISRPMSAYEVLVTFGSKVSENTEINRRWIK